MLTALVVTRYQLHFRSIVQMEKRRMLEAAWMWGADWTFLDGDQHEQAGDHELFWDPLGIREGL